MRFIGGGGGEIPDVRAGLRGCWFVIVKQSSSLRIADTGSSGADKCWACCAGEISFRVRRRGYR